MKLHLLGALLALAIATPALAAIKEEPVTCAGGEGRVVPRTDVPSTGPLCGLCSNVALGGTLVQDIPTEWPNALTHSQKEPRDQPTRTVKVMGEGTRLGRIRDAGEVEVNSMHHQAIKRLGDGLREVAWAPDGIIGGVETPGDDRFVVGVQWHPEEELVRRDQAARNLFVAIVEAARRRSRG